MDDPLRQRETWDRNPLGCVLALVTLGAGLVALAVLLGGCAPASPDTLQAAPLVQGARTPTGIPADYAATSSALDLARIHLEGERLSATQTPLAATAAAQDTARAQDWQRVVWTASADARTVTAVAEGATATAKAQGTATAARAPFAAASVTALANRSAVDAKRTEWRLKAQPIAAFAPLVGFGVVLLCLLWVLRAWVDGYRAEHIGVLVTTVEEERPRISGGERPQLTVYHGAPGEVDGMERTDLPCGIAEMNLIAHWVIARSDRSLAVNKWEERGISGRIDEIRDWFLKHDYADQDANNYIVVNRNGENFLRAWQLSHFPTRPPLRGNDGYAAASIHP